MFTNEFNVVDPVGRQKVRSFAVAAMATAMLLLVGVQVSEAKTVTAVMNSDLRVLDPHITTSLTTRHHGYMIYDTLLATDADLQVRPQMADWSVSADALTFTFTLRDGLAWHDGSPVTAEDCVASLKRWASRDAMGKSLLARTASLTAADAKTVVLQLKEPYSLVLESIAKPGAMVPFMMPKRIAETPSDTAVTEYIGSGPFKFVQSEYQPGVKTVYVKNENYKPRNEPASGTAGGKVAKVDRVEWVSMPDTQTAMSALQAGEIDFLEYPSYDMVPILKQDENLIVHATNKFGAQYYGRMNFIHPPFDNQKIRRAAMLAFNQRDFMQAAIGNPEFYRLCGAVFGCGTPFESTVGSQSLVDGGGLEEAKKLLSEAKYDGTPVVIMAPTDIASLKTQPMVAAEALRAAGFTVKLESMDFQSSIIRRNNQAKPTDGGWNLFFSGQPIPDAWNPVVHVGMNAAGKANGWVGWADDPELLALRNAFIGAQPSEQKAIAEKIQARVLDQVIYIPIGEAVTPSVWRKSLTGVLDGPASPVFWNINKAD